jgi:hypothetical protein
MGKIITVDFRQDTLFAIERDDGVFVALKPICETLGLDWKAQHRRLSSDAILSEGMVMTAIPSPGGTQETTCLRLDLVNGWLFTIDDSRVKDEVVRQKVLAYKRECYSVLFQHFYGKVAQPSGATIDTSKSTEEADGPKVRMVTEARHTFGNQSAAQLWFLLGLPKVPAMTHDPRQPSLFNYEAIKSAPEETAAA